MIERMEYINDKMRSQLRALIGRPSVSSTSAAYDQSNQGVLDALESFCREVHGNCERMAVPTDGQAEKSNLIATFGGGDPGICFSGHSDTVPCNPDLWQTDPFELSERENRFYGLGTADMKGFFPAVLAAVNEVGPSRLRRSVRLVATSDEESTMAGARALRDAGADLGDAVIIGEPTSLTPIRAHKGVMALRLTISGLAGHASDPSLGHNALDAMTAAMAALLRFRERELARSVDSGFPVDRPTMNFGAINGGDNPNRICGRCELLLDVRILPGQDILAIINSIRETAQAAINGSGTTLALEPMLAPVPPFATAADSKLVHLSEHLTGHHATAVNFGTEAPFFTMLGVDTIVLGAGDIAQAHQPNEYVEHSDLNRLVPTLAKFIEHYCVD